MKKPTPALQAGWKINSKTEDPTSADRVWNAATAVQAATIGIATDRADVIGTVVIMVRVADPATKALSSV